MSDGSGKPDKSREPTMAAIIEALEWSYTNDGIAAWLWSRHAALGGDRPIQRCADKAGRTDVLELAEALQEAMG